MSFARFGRNVTPRRTRQSRQQRRAFLFESLEERLALSVNFTDLDDDSAADNDTLGTAQAIVHPGLATGVVDSWTPGTGTVANVTDGDPDWYSVSASVVGDLKFAVRNLGGDPNSDGATDTGLKISVLNNANTVISGPTTLADGDSVVVTTPAGVTTDVFKIVVEGTDAAQDANYQLRVWNLDTNDDGTGSPANNNTRADATVITLSSGAGADLNNTITRPDRDYYKITSDVTGPLEVQVIMPAGTGLPTGSNGPTNLGVRVRDNSGAIIATSNGTTTNIDVARFDAVNGQMYFVEVYSGSVGQVNRYDLDIQPLPPPTGQISGFKYHDLNQDGFQDLNEPGLQNWIVFIDSTDNDVLDNPVNGNGVCNANATEPCATTDATGFYQLMNVPAGTNEVREVPQAGWAQTYPGPEDSGVHTINISENTILDHIDFGNIQLGSIVVTKDALPNDGQDFGFTTTGGLSPAGFSLDDDADGTLSNVQAFNGLLPGTYTITEGAVAGWTLTNLVINDPTNNSSVSGSTATIVVDPGEAVTLTYENTKLGSIKVTKDALPDDAQDFGFTTTGGLAPATFDLDDDADGTLSNMRTFGNLLPGTYTITETAVTGWSLTNLVINDPTNNSSVSGNTATIVVDDGEDITLTFENTKLGSIKVTKDAIPDSGQDFPFTTTGGLSPTTFDLDDDSDGTLSNMQTFGSLLPGTYTITEGAVAGWALTDLVINDPTNNSSVSGNVATIVVDPGDDITLTFENTKVGSIKVTKDALPDHAQNFDFTTTGGLAPATFSLDDDADNTLSNMQTFGNVLPGTYTITEAAVGGWSLSNLVINDPTNNSSVSGNTATIVVDAGEDITLTFENTKLGSIKVTKDALPDHDQDFAYTTTGGLAPAAFSLDDDADNTLSNMQSFNGLAPGTYTITEGTVAGWSLTNLVINDPTNNSSVSGTTATLVVDPGDDITLTFENTKLGSIKVTKDATPDDPQDFSFTTTGGLTPAAFDLDDDADGTLPNMQSFGSLLPGTYTITEAAVPGWTLTGLVINDPTNNSSVSGSTATIVVDPGDDITLTFENTEGAGLTVIKDAIPDDGQDFSYTTTGGLTPAGFSLDDDADNTLSNMQMFSPAPGTYTITEGSVPGWTLTGLIIIDPTNNSSVSGSTATIVVDPGDNITVTYENTKLGTLKVTKDTDPDDPQDFTFSTTGGLTPATFMLDDDADNTLPNMENFIDLVPGTYTITEGSVPGWELTDIVINDPTNNSSISGDTATIVIDPGDAVEVTFTNEVTPAFDGIKFHDLNTNGIDDGGTDPGLSGWTIQLYKDDGDGVFEPGPFGLTGEDALIDTDVTDSDGEYRLGDQGLANGTYFVREVQQTGWRQTTSPAVYTVTYTSGTTSTNDFGNAQCNLINTGAGNSMHTVTATNNGVLSFQLSDGLFEVWDAANTSPVNVFHFEQGADRVAGNDGDDNDGDGTPHEFINEAGGQSSESVLDGVQRADVLTTIGTTYTIRVSGAAADSVLTYLNAVNVDTAGTLALQIAGTECGDLIAVGDDIGGGPSDAKAIFIGHTQGEINGGVDLTAEGFHYRTAIIDAIFGQPTISRVEINGNGGDDVIRVQKEITLQQTLNGGDGNDNIRGGDGKATIFGGAGHDLLIGGGADDVLNGGEGDDAVYGLAGADRAFGGNGNDWIGGGADSDPLLRGGNGNDRISGGAGRDRLLGDSGSDLLYRDAIDLLVSGGTSINTPPDPVNDALVGLVDDFWEDSFLTDSDEDAAKDTLDELINSILP